MGVIVELSRKILRKKIENLIFLYTFLKIYKLNSSHNFESMQNNPTLKP